MKSTKVFLIPCADYKDLNPVDGGYQTCPPDFTYGPNARNYDILHYVVSGKGTLKKDKMCCEIKAKQCFVIRHGETAFYKADSTNPWTYIWLGFKTNMPLPEQIAKEDIFDAHEYEHIFLPLMNLAPTNPNLDIILCSKCWELFTMLRCTQTNNVCGNPADRAKLYIENEYMNDISVSEIAAMLYTDRTTFSKSFKRNFGVSPQKYICDYRLKMALNFLNDNKYTLTDAAVLSGYRDYSNFSRMFKRKYGICPNEYKNHRQTIKKPDE